MADVEALQQQNQHLTGQINALQQRLNELQAAAQQDPNALIIQQLQRNERNRMQRENQNFEQKQDKRLEDEIVAQIDVCDGHTPQAVRQWLKAIDTSIMRTGDGAINIRIANRTVKGALLRELEQYLHSRVNDANHPVGRENVPWDDIKTYITRAFLPVDNVASLRDEIEHMRQSPYETEASYNRRFREVADDAYPVQHRNADQHSLLIKAYIKGLQSSDIAKEVVLRGRPETLPAAQEQVMTAAAGKEAYARIGRKEEPMEVGALQQQQQKEPLTLAVNQLTTAVAKLEVQTRQTQKQQTKNQIQTKEKSRHKAYQPSRCFLCGRFGHLKNDCRTPYCNYHKTYGHTTNNCKALRTQRPQQGSYKVNRGSYQPRSSQNFANQSGN